LNESDGANAKPYFLTSEKKKMVLKA